MALNDGQDIAALADAGSFNLTPEQAAAQLAQMKVEYDKRSQSSVIPEPPPGALANAGTAPPVNAVEAHTKLEAFRNDPAKGAKLMAGDSATMAEFNELTSAVAASSTTELAMAGLLPINHVDVESAMPLQDQITAVDDLRQSGFLDDEIRDVLDNKPISKLEHLLTQERWRERMGDKEWRAELADKDYATTREWKRICANLNKPIEDK
jgi:hypothetical protein